MSEFLGDTLNPVAKIPIPALAAAFAIADSCCAEIIILRQQILVSAVEHIVSLFHFLETFHTISHAVVIVNRYIIVAGLIPTREIP